MFLQDIKLQDGVKEIFKVSRIRKSKTPSKRSSFLSTAQAMKYMIRLLFDSYHQKSSQKSLNRDGSWVLDQVVMGPRSGVLKAQFVGKGFTQIDSLERASLRSLTKRPSMLTYLRR